MAMMSLSESAVLTLRMAHNFAVESGLETIGTEHILYAIINQGNSNAANMLKNAGVDLDELADEIEELSEKNAEKLKNAKEKEKYSRKTKNCSTCLTQMPQLFLPDYVIFNP